MDYNERGQKWATNTANIATVPRQRSYLHCYSFKVVSNCKPIYHYFSLVKFSSTVSICTYLLPI